MHLKTLTSTTLKCFLLLLNYSCYFSFQLEVHLVFVCILETTILIYGIINQETIVCSLIEIYWFSIGLTQKRLLKHCVDLVVRVHKVDIV